MAVSSCGAAFGCDFMPGRRFFCVYMDTNMDTDKKKPNKIRAFVSMSMGSSPTAGINWGSVENSAFPRFFIDFMRFSGL